MNKEEIKTLKEIQKAIIDWIPEKICQKCESNNIDGDDYNEWCESCGSIKIFLLKNWANDEINNLIKNSNA